MTRDTFDMFERKERGRFGDWIPKSQIKIEETGPLERKRNGRTSQPCIIEMPSWLAKEKGLI